MKKRKLIFLISFLFVLVVAFFFQEGKDNSNWNEVIVTKGLMNEEVELTEEAKKQLITLMYEDYVSEPYIKQEDKVYYGGSIYQIRFLRDEKEHRWFITDNQIIQIIEEQENDFNPNKGLIRRINSIIRGEKESL